MARSKLMSFSHNGENLAHTGSDGILRIWNTTSGRLEHEYKPAEHLTATISCIRYAPLARNKGKKNQNSKLLVMGTMAGTILIYNTLIMEVIATLEHSPPHAVVDIVCQGSKNLISLGEDGTIVKWTVADGKRVKTISVNEGNSVCIIDKTRLAVGHRSIQLLSTVEETAQCIQTYTGHMSVISQLLPITDENNDPKYILSSSEDDRFFYAWDLLKGKKEAVASFMVNETISSVAAGDMCENTIMLSAVTSSGRLIVFRQHLNGSVTKKAVKPVGKLTILAATRKERRIPILASSFCKNNDIIFVYGSSSVLKFVRQNVNDIVGDKTIKREEPKGLDLNETLMKTVTPQLSKDVTLISAKTQNAFVPENEKKRKHGDEDGFEGLPMEERLNALVINKPTTTTRIPTGDNMKQLLLQGLQSKDRRILSSILTRTDHTIIKNTVQQLPTSAVVPLLEHLQLLFMGKGHKHGSYIIWIRTILYHHMSHLSTIPNSGEIMRPILSTCMSRLSAHAQVTKLHARLDLMLNHVRLRNQTQEEVEPEPAAMLIYRDDSSDEEDNVRRLGVSESEDQWEEMSDYTGINGHSDTDSEMDADDNLRAKRKMDEDEIVLDSDSDDGDDEAEDEDSNDDDIDDEEEEEDEEDSDDDKLEIDESESD